VFNGEFNGIIPGANNPLQISSRASRCELVSGALFRKFCAPRGEAGEKGRKLNGETNSSG